MLKEALLSELAKYFQLINESLFMTVYLCLIRVDLLPPEGYLSLLIDVLYLRWVLNSDNLVLACILIAWDFISAYSPDLCIRRSVAFLHFCYLVYCYLLLLVALPHIVTYGYFVWQFLLHGFHPLWVIGTYLKHPAVLNSLHLGTIAALIMCLLPSIELLSFVAVLVPRLVSSLGLLLSCH